MIPVSIDELKYGVRYYLKIASEFNDNTFSYKKMYYCCHFLDNCIAFIFDLADGLQPNFYKMFFVPKEKVKVFLPEAAKIEWCVRLRQFCEKDINTKTNSTVGSDIKHLIGEFIYKSPDLIKN